MKKCARIISTGSFLPKKTLDNQYFSNYLETSNEWIQKRTGIKKRHIIETETVSDMAYEAAHQAIKAAQLDPQAIEMILVATNTPDRLFPSVASTLQSRLNIEHCFAMDVSAACSGFIYALDVAQKYILSGTSNILVVGVDALSRYLDWNDRKTCILFGDGAGAAVVSSDENTGIIDSHLQNIPHQIDMLKLDIVKQEAPRELHQNPYIQMDGQAVFKMAVTELCNLTEKLLKKNQINLNDIDFLVPHQANIRIINAIAAHFGFAEEKIIKTISDQGNTSASSIPSALDQAVKKGQIKKNQLLLLLGFGAGITMGGTLLRY